MFGCSTRVSPDQVYGTYVASYPFGTDTLTLNRDGTFVQQVAIENDQHATVKGEWSLDPDGSSANVRGLLSVDDGNGRLNSNWRDPTSIPTALDVEMHWFKIVMESGAEHPYVKRR